MLRTVLKRLQWTIPLFFPPLNKNHTKKGLLPIKQILKQAHYVHIDSIVILVFFDDLSVHLGKEVAKEEG